jgi:hypothetical protein
MGRMIYSLNKLIEKLTELRDQNKDYWQELIDSNRKLGEEPEDTNPGIENEPICVWTPNGFAYVKSVDFDPTIGITFDLLTKEEFIKERNHA